MGTDWWGVVKRVRWRYSALDVAIVAWVVPVGSSTVGKIRSGPDPWCLGALVVPEACLEVESLECFFPCVGDRLHGKVVKPSFFVYEICLCEYD